MDWRRETLAFYLLGTCYKWSGLAMLVGAFWMFVTNLPVSLILMVMGTYAIYEGVSQQIECTQARTEKFKEEE